MENRENTFTFTYSAEEQAEIERIRKEYLPKEEDKMVQLRKLHNSATQKAQAWSIGLGTVGALILGLGMSLCMTDLGAALGIFATILGILAGLAGLVLVALAYPMYNRVLTKERQKIAPEVLRLTEELLQ